MGDDKKLDGPLLPASSRFDWSDLRVFLHVADTGSISGAAKSLQMSQPTVSLRLRELELRLNTQLAVRTATGVQLTDAGEQIRQHAMAMQRAAHAVDRMLRECDDRLEGRVRLCAPDGILAFWIAPRLPAFQRINPDITISADGGIWPDDPLKDDVDLSLQYDARNFGEHVVEPLATVHYAPFASERYLELYGTPQSQAEMAAHRTIHHAAVQQQKETWDPKAEAVRTLSAYNIETNCSAAIAMSVLAGGGISFMPTFVASYMAGLVMLGEAPAASPILYLVYNPRTVRVARAEKLITWLKDCFDERTNPWFRQEFVHPREFSMLGDAGALHFTPPS